MTMLQEQAIEMIKQLSDDKIYYIVSILEGIEGLYSVRGSQEKAKAQKAYQELQQYRKSSPVERDYKAELAEALEEKYARID